MPTLVRESANRAMLQGKEGNSAQDKFQVIRISHVSAQSPSSSFFFDVNHYAL